jgi:hypothetical protein
MAAFGQMRHAFVPEMKCNCAQVSGAGGCLPGSPDEEANTRSGLVLCP